MSKIIATMATFPARAAVVEQAVASMADQVDKLNLVLNEHREVPAWTRKYPSLNPIIPEVDTKDTGKYLIPVGEQDWLFTIDDDILYPADYVKKSLEAMQRFGSSRLIAGYHGISYRKPRYLPSNRLLRKLFRLDPNYIVTSYNRYHFLHALDQDFLVDELGTGTTLSRGQDVPPFSEVKTAQRFIDVRLARWAHQTGRKMVCLAHTAGWMRSVSVAEETSIYRSFTLGRPEQVALEIETYAFRKPGAGRPI